VLPVDQGGAGLSVLSTSAVVILTQVGMWFGYVTFGFVADALGRKRAYAAFVLAASLLLPVFGYIRSPIVLFALGPIIARSPSSLDRWRRHAASAWPLPSPVPRFFSPRSRCTGCQTRAATTCSDRGSRVQRLTTDD
jgi:MFS family permease